MAIDQNLIPNDLRPLNSARTVGEETRLPNTTAVAGFPPNLVFRSEFGSPSLRPAYYPLAVLDSSGNQTAVWYPHQQIPPSLGGMGEIPNFRVGGNASDHGIDEGVDELLSVKKVKLMCSFGGKILLRPNDGLLRYVGGQTRIISVRRDISFQELQHKMIDTYGQPVVIKYQLPNEDLDALVSVSCPEDLENMMDEYGKLVEDGSGKLRVFLFSASELDQSALMKFGDVLDNGQRYIDAINGIHDGVGGGISRKESNSSATSTQNSDGQMSWGEAVESLTHTKVDGGGIPSPCMSSPRVAISASQDVSTSTVYVAHNPVMFAEPPPIPMGHPITGVPTLSLLQPESRERAVPTIVKQPPPLGYNLQQPSGFDFQPPAGYVQAYVDPRQQISSQIGYQNPQFLGIAQSGFGHTDPQQQLQGNVVGFPPQQLIPAVHMTVAPAAPHGGMNANGLQHFIQPPNARVDPYPGEKPCGARAVQFPADQVCSAYQSQASLPLQTGGYSWSQLPPAQHVVRSDGWATPQPGMLIEEVMKVQDCLMCHKALPHAHTDTLPKDHLNSINSSFSDTNPIFYSSPVEGNLGTRPPNKVIISKALEDLTTELQESRTQPRAGGNMGHDVAENQFRVPGFQDQESQQAKESNMQKLVNPGMLPPPVMGKPGDIKSSHGVLLGSICQTNQERALRQPSAPLPYQVKHEGLVSSQPGGINAPPVRMIQLQTSDTMAHDSMTEYLGKFPFDGRIKFHPSPSDISATNGQCSSPITKLTKEGIPVGGAHITGQDVFTSNGFPESGIVPDGDHSKLCETVPSSTPEIAYFHDYQPVESNQARQAEFGISGPYPHLNRGVQHGPSDQIWFDKPTFSGVDSAYSNDRALRVGEWKDETLRMAPNDVVVDPLIGISISPSDGMVQDKSDAAPSNSLFSHQDPWTLRHDGHVPFPNTSGVPSSKEAFNMREDRVLQESEGHPNEDPSIEHVRSDKEEHIKEELKAVAEGVAALVLQSSIPADVSVHDVDEPTPVVSQNRSNDNSADAKTTARVQDIRTKLPDKSSTGLPISEGIGRLQIIKNSDLEQLRELGSGKFGTVYHGKWRGTDVAIKRINDRCFAGKSSAEDHMREDFWNEAIKLADLHHPNVLAFYGVVLDGPGGSVATLTEYMVNGSLRQALQRNDRAFDKRKRLFIAMDVAFAMEYLHGKNIVHFDLKSDNLLVNLRDPHRPICKVGDLGLSKVKCQTLISGGVRGTLPWMAPELLNGSSNLVSEKVDVFSFGIVMWELLTGEEPYADLHYGAIIGGIVSNTLRPAVPESCDSEWRYLMESCWSAEPSERPSFTEIAKQLRVVATSLPLKGQAQQQTQVQK